MNTKPLSSVAIIGASVMLFAICLIVQSPKAGIAIAAAATPQPSPTTAPTPYMPLEEIPNGNWDVIEQGYASIEYSRMVLREIGNTVTGTWYVDGKTTYVLDGSRDGSHLTLQIKSAAKPDATVIGKMEADIDGIADMVGLITMGQNQIAFQGAQHGRVPPPVDSSTPAPEQSPY
ncbi:MAG TPA: hypothetical protein VFO25_13730 [Candidatus Eremiobacteraceae bacterium]|nr:hypothetical protein [Candidatus Eremiobacteraceae bacterium]